MNISYHTLHWDNVDLKILESHNKVMNHFNIPIQYMNMNIELVPYKNNNKSHIKKYHISNSDNLILKYKICNVFAPFGRQYLHQTKEKINQHVGQGFSPVLIDDSIEKINIAKTKNYKTYHFKTISEFKKYIKKVAPKIDCD